MASGTRERTDYGVDQVAAQLRDQLGRYIEGRYHLRDEGVIGERRLLLEEPGAIGQRPYIETTPAYRLGSPYDDLGLPAPVATAFTTMASWRPSIGVFERPYAHQAEALRAFFVDGQDLIVATGTGSGKTETFLFPILGQLVMEGETRPTSFGRPGCRALLLYPMNALVSDQVSRLRRLFGDERVGDHFVERYGRPPRFGMYTSRTPYAGPRTTERDRRHLEPLLRYYLDLEPGDSGDGDQQRQAALAAELRVRGRWPAKDLAEFAGMHGSRSADRYRTHPRDRELLTRHEIQHSCPDILVTNYSMLEYMLLRPIERSIFAQTRDWLAADPRNEFLLVLDEAHVYRGAGGAEVALLVRRLQSRLGIDRDRLRCVLTSASLGAGDEARDAVRQFATGLVGRPSGGGDRFRLVQGAREERVLGRRASEPETAALAAFDLASFFRRVEDPAGASNAIRELAGALGWPPPPCLTNAEEEVRRYLYDRLDGFGPLEWVIGETAGNARAFDELAAELFPGTRAPSDAAASSLLALATYAHNGERPLLPTRAHLLFRGLPSLFACINPRCDRRRHRPGEELLLGRLYTEPRTRCDCAEGARVYEVLAHRECGAAFLRVFGRGEHADFYWHEQGGAMGDVGDPLDETIVLAEEPHPDMLAKVEPVWIELATGRVSRDPASDPGSYRLVYRPVAKEASRRATGVDGRPRRPKSLVFGDCPACTKRNGGRKIHDLATKGDQPFANLVRDQLVLQPAVRPSDEHYPNAGKKVLLFSDGRQKAARLARDLPREVEFDSFRQALALAVRRLESTGREATLDGRLYVALVSVCQNFHLHLFDREGGSQALLLDHIARFRRFYGGDLFDALDDEWRPNPPLRYLQALLQQLADPYYSLYAVGAAVGTPTRRAVRHLEQRLPELPERARGEHLARVATAWVQAMLDRTAFDPKIGRETRFLVDEFFEPTEPGTAVERIERLLRDGAGLDAGQVGRVRDCFYEVLTERDADGYAYLNPSAIRLDIAVDATWHRCVACSLIQHEAPFGRCTWCGRAQIAPRPPDHPHMVSLTGYFREPIRAVLAGERPIHVTAEEHTAQLSQRDVGVVQATTEEFELRFQDVELGADKPPVDVLSCTTTMEVGIDIGSLTAVGLRNVPPQRENYQQRAGRAGRRGAAVSTVLTYAENAAHDNHYYHHPSGMISGAPRQPKVKVDNKRLAQRHVHSFLIQTFFHSQLDLLPKPEQERLAQAGSHLFSALGKADDFFDGDGEFSLGAFSRWVEADGAGTATGLARAMAAWLPDELVGSDAPAGLAKEQFARKEARAFLTRLEQLASDRRKQRLGETAAGRDLTTGEGQSDALERPEKDDLLLDVLFDTGLLPSYAFPTDLCSFYVFERDGSRVRIKERPQQAKDRALSEYAPGRLLVINKETYRVGGVFVEGAKSGSPAKALFAEPLGTYVYCARCTYVRLGTGLPSNDPCPVCGDPLVSRELLDPPGFSPEGGEALRERDRDLDLSYATGAQFPTPVEPDRFTWLSGAGARLRHTYERDRRLVVVNKGPSEQGFTVCESCGAAWPSDRPVGDGRHPRPFLMDRFVRQREGSFGLCRGPLHEEPIYLGHDFLTDLVLLRLSIHHPMCYDPRDPCLQDALRSLAEATALAASLHLDIDPGELSAGFRLMPPDADDNRGARGAVDLYVFDTASGGAGYAAEVGEALPAVLDRTLEVLIGCPGGCERSCTKCLRHYGNRFWHERLDRHLAAQLLRYARHGRVPEVADPDEQARQLAPLRRYLELEGWTCAPGGLVSGVPVPLRLSSRRGRAGSTEILVGTVPGLLDSAAPGFAHPLQRAAPTGCVALLSDYVLARDLPTAAELMHRRAGIG